MDNVDVLTFLFGAGSAGTVVGSLILWRVKKSWESLDKVPELINCVNKLKTTVDAYSGELRALERSMYQNHTNIAVTNQKVEAAFREVDLLKSSVREMKL